MTQSPETFKGGDIWNIITTLAGAMQGIGYGLLVLFFAMGVFQSAAGFKEMQRPEFALRHFIRFAGAKVAVGYSMDIMSAIFKICGGIVGNVMDSMGGMVSAGADLPTEIVDAIEIYLSQEGYQILKAYDGLQAVSMMEKQEIQLLIIDIMMPKLDGLRATLKIREKSSIPIIILSAKSEDADKILGLNIGADDYVTKPFNPLELVARVKSQLRRYTKLGNAAEESQKIYQTGGLVMNDDLKEVTVDGEPVKLTPIEYNILLLLVKNQGKVFSINQIYESIWNEDAIGADNTVAVHIRHIREKIEINAKEPRYLKVVWGIGYKVEKL